MPQIFKINSVIDIKTRLRIEADSSPVRVKTIKPPVSTTDWFAHTKDYGPVAEQPIRLLEQHMPMAQQQQSNGRLKMKRGERVKLRNRQIAAQKAMMNLAL